MNRRDFLRTALLTFGSLRIGAFSEWEKNEESPENETPKDFTKKLFETIKEIDENINADRLPGFDEMLFSLVCGDIDNDGLRDKLNEIVEKEIGNLTENPLQNQDARSTIIDKRKSEGSGYEAEFVELRDYRILPKEIKLSALLGNSEALKIIELYVKHNHEYGFVETEKESGRIPTTSRVKPMSGRVSKAHIDRVRKSRENISDTNPDKEKIDLVYPMDNWRAIADFTSNVVLCWSSLSDEDKGKYIKPIDESVRHWEGVVDDFHGLIPKYLSLNGDILNDTVSPDGSIARPVAHMSEMAVLLRSIGENDIADRLENMAGTVLINMDKVFWVDGKVEKDGKLAILGRSMGHSSINVAENADVDRAIFEARANASLDLPGDGTRVVVSRASYVRMKLLKDELSDDEKSEIESHIKRAVTELETFYYMLSDPDMIHGMHEWNWEKGTIPKPLSPESERSKLFDGRVVLANGYALESDKPHITTRWLAPNQNEASHPELPDAIVALRELARDSKIMNSINKHFGSDNDIVKILEKHLKYADWFVGQLFKGSDLVNRQRAGYESEEAKPSVRFELARLLDRIVPLTIDVENGVIEEKIRYSAVIGNPAIR